MKDNVELQKKTSDFKLKISKNLQNKIDYLCNRFPNTEWSGILYYKHTGSFEKNNLSITAQDLLLMDIGSGTFTEFEMSPEVAVNLVEHQELMDCCIGLVHSHGAMAAFFSGTDLNTLKEEGSERNHFLSLIVNNAGNYVAAITKKATYDCEITGKKEYFSFGNKHYFEPVKRKKQYDVVEYYELEILKPETIVKNDELDNRIREIEEAKKPKINPMPYNDWRMNQLELPFEGYERVTPNFRMPVETPETSWTSATTGEIDEIILKTDLARLVSLNYFIDEEWYSDETLSTDDILEEYAELYALWDDSFEDKWTEFIKILGCDKEELKTMLQVVHNSKLDYTYLKHLKLCLEKTIR